ncbi:MULTISPECIES: MFS transporter [Roseomonadaceae]|uniref:MFS transporter n=1 Tax=Falsiroseomonas oleicola TaxID=2801474 RepID=A0ABS6H449_9PROT|nr:MFS transporter [Roseomonas oleicola]MBU8543453.1 MFS transporter [Roseomonas oleicola]
MTPPPDSGAPAQTVPPAELRRLFFRVFPAVGLAMFGAALDQTLVAAALPAIARGLGDVERLSWIIVLYLVANTVAAPVYGRLGDAFGRQRMLLVALAVYATGATLCAFAGSLGTLAAARVVQGIGGGGLISLSVALIAEVVPARERGRFQAYIAAVFTTASALGPVLGGLLAEHFGWRSIFALQLPLSCLAAWLAVTRLGDASRGQSKGFSFDWWGLVLFAVFVAPALMALDQARRLTPGPLLVALGLAAVAGTALWLLLRQEKRAPDPLLPLDVLGHPTIWRANLMSSCVAGAFVGSIAFLPIYFAAVRGLSPAQLGLALLPLSACAGFGAMTSGALLARTGHVMRWPGIGLSLSSSLLLVLTIGLPALSLPVMAGLLGLISVGFGMSFPMVQVSVQVAAGPKRLGSATASVQFTRSLGAATGTALLGAVLFGSLTVMGEDATRLFVALVNQGPAALAGLDAAAEAVFRAQMTTAFRASFGTATLLVAFAAWMSTRVPLRRV